MYTIQENVRILIALLKQYEIRYVVVSPGGTNIPISQAVQDDPYFRCYSIPDERSAMYLYTSGYNIIFDTREDYDAALTKKESLEQDICLTLNKLTIDTLRRKTTIQPIIRFLYRDLIKDIDEMDKENRKQF